MSEKIYKSIDYVTYMKRLKKLFEDAQCLLEDISPCSDAMYFIETIYSDNIYKYKGYVYQHVCLRNISDIWGWMSELKNELSEDIRNNADDLLFWRIVKYDDYKNCGCIEHQEFVAILNCDGTIIDLYLNFTDNNINSEIRSLYNEWTFLLGSCKRKNDINETILVDNCPFEIGDIIGINRVCRTQKHYYVYLGSLHHQQGEFLLDCDYNFQRHTYNNSKIIRISLGDFFNPFEMNKVKPDDCQDKRAKISSKLVEKPEFICLLSDYADSMIKTNFSEKYDLSTEIDNYIAMHSNMSDSKDVWEWTIDEKLSDNENESELKNYIKEVHNMLEKLHPVSINELNIRMRDFFDEAYRDVFTTCNSREIYQLKNIFRENTYIPDDYEQIQGLYKETHKIIETIRNYVYTNYIEANTKETVKEIMYWEVIKYTLDSSNQYVETVMFRFNTDAELIDIKFYDSFKMIYVDDRYIQLYDKWQEFNSPIAMTIDSPKYGDVLTIDIRPIYSKIELIYLGDGETNNSYYGLVCDDTGVLVFANVEYYYKLGMGVCGIFSKTKRENRPSFLIEELSKILKANPALEDELLDIYNDNGNGLELNDSVIEEFISWHKKN